MKLCVGTAKGVVIIDPERSTPLLALADPSSVWCMAQDCDDPSVLYAGAVDNVHFGSARGRATLARSLDAGRSWSDITPRNAREDDVWAIAAAPDRSGELFVGTSHARLLRSLDRGQTFRECAAFLNVSGRSRWTGPLPPHIPHVRSLAFDRSKPPALYIGVEEGGVIRSRNRGETFEVVSGISEDVHGLACDPGDPAQLYAATGEGLFVSHDAGASWRLAHGLNRSYAVPVFASGAGVVHVGAASGAPPLWSRPNVGADSAIFRSVDGGMNFKALVQEPWPVRAMVMRMRADPRSSGALFAVTNDGYVLGISGGPSPAVTTIAHRLPPSYDFAVLE
ncbi:MAG TPA: hypothetical protein VNF45_02150 [Candidatus Binataceae bacterium]|nr:hypothetical protein [Candidatus Binataceae bacterium]